MAAESTPKTPCTWISSGVAGQGGVSVRHGHGGVSRTVPCPKPAIGWLMPGRAAQETAVDDVPHCLPWWPRLLWDLHFLPRPWPGPVPHPPAMEDILANLHIHAMSYQLLDQGAAQQIRSIAEERLVEAARNLSKHHDQARARSGELEQKPGA
jgi:hypothetical protein